MICSHDTEVFSRLRKLNREMLKGGSGYIHMADDGNDAENFPKEKKMCRIIAVDNKTHEIVRIFYSIADAGEAFKRRPATIKGAIYGYTKYFCGGRYTLYREGDYQNKFPGFEIVCHSEPPLDFSESRTMKNHTLRATRARKAVWVFTPEGELIQRFDDTEQAAMFAKTNPLSITKVCTGQYKTSKGFRFSYTDQPPVYQYQKKISR